MNKRTKKYNPNKAVSATANFLVKNYVLLMNLALTDKDINMFHIKHMRCYAPTNEVQKLFQEHPFNWSYVIVVYTTESNGKIRATGRFIKAPYPCVQREIYKSLNQAHSDLIAQETAKGNNLHNAAWAAIPFDLGNLIESQEEEWIDKCLHYLEVYNG